MNVNHLKKLTLLSPVPAIVVGILLLTLGRKLFWLFVAAIGFIVGVELTTPMFPRETVWIFVAGLGFGLAGAVLAILVQKVAVAVGGFLAGGYFLMMAARAWALQVPGYSWAAFLVGGVVGAIMMIYVFNWALVLFSSISGAHLIVHALPSDQAMASAIFVGLMVVGCIIQGRALTARITHEV